MPKRHGTRIDRPHRVRVVRGGETVEVREFPDFDSANKWCDTQMPVPGKAAVCFFDETTIVLDHDPLPPPPPLTPEAIAFRQRVTEWKQSLNAEAAKAPVPDLTVEQWEAAWRAISDEYMDIFRRVVPLLKAARKNSDLPLPSDALKVFVPLLEKLGVVEAK